MHLVDWGQFDGALGVSGVGCVCEVTWWLNDGDVGLVVVWFWSWESLVFVVWPWPARDSHTGDSQSNV